MYSEGGEVQDNGEFIWIYEWEGKFEEAGKEMRTSELRDLYLINCLEFL